MNQRGNGASAGRAAGRHRRARGIQHHGEQRVVAGNADRVNDALLPERLQHACVGGVADGLVLMQLGAEIVEDLLVFGHPLRPAPFGDGAGDVLAQAGLERELIVRVPLVVLRPVARGDQDRELAQARREDALEAQVVAHRARPVHDLGAAEQRHERPARRSALRAARNSSTACCCASRHLLRRNRRQAILGGCSHRPIRPPAAGPRRCPS